MNEKRPYGQSVRPFFIPWRWRDSNSRPNEELICFLHVYLRLHCRGRARPKPPTHPLSSKVSPETRGLSQTISDIAAPPDRNASEPQHPGDVTSPQLLQGLSLNHYTSIKQRERNYFRQLIVRCLRFKCKPTTHYMLTNHFYPLSKPVIPMVL